jgi:molybdenum cofactor biosynthesis enzyme
MLQLRERGNFKTGRTNVSSAERKLRAQTYKFISLRSELMTAVRAARHRQGDNTATTRQAGLASAAEVAASVWSGSGLDDSTQALN